jgi:hypothetical protein
MSEQQIKTELAANSAKISHYRRDLHFLNGTAPVNFGDTVRDDSKEYGYPDQITFYHMYNAYRRGGFFKGLVDIIPNRCFAEGFQVIDGEDNDTEQDTEFEKQAKKLIKQFNLTMLFREAFKYRDVGWYSTIVPIFKEPGEQADLKSELMRAASLANGGVIAINPFYQLECEGSSDYVTEYGKDWNKPKTFQLNPSALAGRQTTVSEQIDLDRSRVFVLTNSVGAQIEGTPALEAPFNALFDSNKIRGAAAEGFRKNAKQRTVMSALNPEAAKAMSAKSDEIDESIDEFERGFKNMLKAGGVDIKALQSTLADPLNFSMIALQEACSARGVPVTELIGFMTGQRSSTENSSAFNKNLKSVQHNDYGSHIERFFMWLVDLGVLAKPTNGSIKIKWPDIAEPTLTEKLENAGKMVEQNEKAFRSNEPTPWSVEEIRQVAGSTTKRPESEFQPKTDLSLDDEV